MIGTTRVSVPLVRAYAFPNVGYRDVWLPLGRLVPGGGSIRFALSGRLLNTAEVSLNIQSTVLSNPWGPATPYFNSTLLTLNATASSSASVNFEVPPGVTWVRLNFALTTGFASDVEWLAVDVAYDAILYPPSPNTPLALEPYSPTVTGFTDWTTGIWLAAVPRDRVPIQALVEQDEAERPSYPQSRRPITKTYALRDVGGVRNLMARGLPAQPYGDPPATHPDYYDSDPVVAGTPLVQANSAALVVRQGAASIAEEYDVGDTSPVGGVLFELEGLDPAGIWQPTSSFAFLPTGLISSDALVTSTFDGEGDSLSPAYSYAYDRRWYWYTWLGSSTVAASPPIPADVSRFHALRVTASLPQPNYPQSGETDVSPPYVVELGLYIWP